MRRPASIRRRVWLRLYLHACRQGKISARLPSKRAGEGASGRAGGGGACPRNWQELGDLIVNGASMQSGDDRAHDRALLHLSRRLQPIVKNSRGRGAPNSFLKKKMIPVGLVRVHKLQEVHTRRGNDADQVAQGRGGFALWTFINRLPHVACGVQHFTLAREDTMQRVLGTCIAATRPGGALPSRSAQRGKPAMR